MSLAHLPYEHQSDCKREIEDWYYEVCEAISFLFYLAGLVEIIILNRKRIVKRS